MEISVCIITKNECGNLRKCLDALSSYGFELVVVDTGSSDGTVRMVQNYTDALYQFEWCNDFAKAKNYAVSKASNDMVLVLDSDEYVTDLDVTELEKQIREHPKQVGRILRRNLIYQGNEIRKNTEYINRLFDRRHYHYEGCIHEQLVASGEISEASETIMTYQTGICADHSGYLLSKEEKKQKAARNIALLRQMLAEQGDDPYLLYQVGKSCYMAEQYEEACSYLGKVLSFDLDEKLEYVIDAVETYGYALVNSGQAQAALGFEGLTDAFGSRSDFWFLMGVIYMNNELFQEAVNAYEQAVKLGNARMEGADSFLAYYNAGVIRECLGQLEAAEKFYRKAGDYAPAERRLEILMAGIEDEK